MSERHVAFLRAINVGGRVVKMDVLRALFSQLGLANVATLIASGNVLFDFVGEGSKLEPKIEAHLRKSLGYDVATMIRPVAALSKIHGAHPFDVEAMTGSTLYVGFLQRTPTPVEKSALLALQTPTDIFHVTKREMYWHALIGMGQSKLTNAKLERALGSPVTFRNATTVGKLAAMR